jgi:hypothetical protein
VATRSFRGAFASGFAVDAAAERDAGEIAAQFVGPVVVDAGESARAAGALQRDQRAAVGAAVLEGGEAGRLVAREHDGHIAEERGLVVAGVGHFGLEAETRPGRAAENALLLVLIDVPVLINPVRDAR